MSFNAINKTTRKPAGYLNIRINLSDGKSIPLGRTIRLFDSVKDQALLDAAIADDGFVVNMTGTVVPVVVEEEATEIVFG